MQRPASAAAMLHNPSNVVPGPVFQGTITVFVLGCRSAEGSAGLHAEPLCRRAINFAIRSPIT
jgi:hypothetical protein